MTTTRKKPSKRAVPKKRPRTKGRPRKRPAAKRRPPKNLSYGRQVLKVAVAMGLLIALVISAAILAEHLMVRKQPVQLPPTQPPQVLPAPKPQPPVQKPVTPQVAQPKPYSLPPALPPLVLPPLPPQPPLPPSTKPRMAIIIDDVGQDAQIVKKLLNLNLNLTFAILPHSPNNQKISGMIRGAGHEIMLHLPMEPNSYPRNNPGPGVLLSSMTADQMIATTIQNLNAVPWAKGVNNHMGSHLTAQSEHMNQVFSVLKRAGLFFIDSRTTAHTVCRSSARLFKVPFANRDVFIDHYPDRPRTEKQLQELVQLAQKRGRAIGIGHPRLLTYQVLKAHRTSLAQNFDLVSASQLVRVVQ